MAKISISIERYLKRAPEFAKWLEENVDEGLTVYQFPKEHWKRLRTSNGMERVNKEIKRRTRVAVLFPNPASALRLVTGIVIEIHEKWVTGKQYLDMGPLLNSFSVYRIPVSKSIGGSIHLLRSGKGSPNSNEKMA